ncbi:MAG: acyltransferase family protein [Phycisphaerales bacterium]
MPPPTNPGPLGQDGPSSPRRHDLDALRAFAMLLGIALHACLAYSGMPWPVNDAPGDGEAYFHFFSFIHGVRMPLFFLLSGFFTAMLWRRRGTRGLIGHRAKRIALPLLIGLVTIVPLSWALAIGVTIVTGSVSAGGPARASETSTSDADLWTAAATGDPARVAYWIGLAEDARETADGADPIDLDAQDPRFGITPLGWTAITGQPEITIQLLEAGADPDARYRDGNVPLHSACFLGRSEVALELLSAGADPLIRSDTGETPQDAMRHGERTVDIIAGLLGIEVDFEAVRAGREEIGPELLEAIAEGDGDDERSVVAGGVPQLVADISFTFPLFFHLWFLWHLCWLVAGFVVVATLLRPIAPALAHVTPIRWLIATPLCLLWLVPLVAAFEFVMDGGLDLASPWPTVLGAQEGPVMGPATSGGVLPMPLVLGYNAIFFGFGAMLYLVRCGANSEPHAGPVRLGRGWWWMLPLALLAYLPAIVMLYADEPGVAELALVQSVPERSAQLWLAGLAQGVFVWTMCFALIGIGELLLSRERRWVRYLSDASYWLYLAHLPLVFVLQALLYFTPLPTWAKFTLVTTATAGLLLISYQMCVRYTLVGRMLNGPRVRPGG